MWKYSIVFFLTLIVFVGCGDSCDNENPTVQLVNRSAEKADVQIKTSGGNTENINNIPRKMLPKKIIWVITKEGTAKSVNQTGFVVHI